MVSANAGSLWSSRYALAVVVAGGVEAAEVAEVAEVALGAAELGAGELGAVEAAVVATGALAVPGLIASVACKPRTNQ